MGVEKTEDAKEGIRVNCKNNESDNILLGEKSELVADYVEVMETNFCDSKDKTKKKKKKKDRDGDKGENCDRGDEILLESPVNQSEMTENTGMIESNTSDFKEIKKKKKKKGRIGEKGDVRMESPVFQSEITDNTVKVMESNTSDSKEIRKKKKK